MNVALRPAPDTLDLISICTGGGGLDLGVELAIPCARPVAMVEREAFAAAHLVEAIEQGLLAPAPVHSDVRTFPGRRFRGLVDGVFGGIPCQPHSLAGKRLEREDPRDLWSPTRRLLVQSGAWLILLENVGGMLSSGGAERVYRDLQRLGFQVEGGLFRASEVGASHERERLFMLAVADAAYHHRRGGDGGAQAGAWARGERRGGPAGGSSDLVNALGRGRHRWPDEPERESQGRTAAELAGQGGFVLADANVVELRREPSAGEQRIIQRDDGVGLFPPGPGDGDAWRSVLVRAPHLEPAVRRMADGLADRLDRLRMLGNGVVPLQAAYALRTLATDLARRSAGAALLVRMMGET